MRNWRPEVGWVEIKQSHCESICSYKPDCEHCPTEPMVCNKSFEAGADAMLKVLVEWLEEHNE